MTDPTFATRAELEALADAILRAAGSGLKHYTEYSRKRIVEAAEQEIARVLAAHAHLLGEG